MKHALIAILFVFLGLFSQAQTQNVNIYCEINPWHNPIKVDYYGVDAFLPDSIKEKILIDYTKQYRFKIADISKILLMLSADGWKLSSVLDSGNIEIYILSKEIPMDEPTRELYLKKIAATFKTAH